MSSSREGKRAALPNLSALNTHNLGSDVSGVLSTLNSLYSYLRYRSATFQVDSKTGCKLEATVMLRPSGLYTCITVDIASGERILGFGGNLEVDDGGYPILNPSSLSTMGGIEWQKAGCRHTVWWAIVCAVGAMNRMFPSVKSITYTDQARVGITDPSLHEDAFVNGIQEKWNTIKSSGDALKLMKPAFYRFEYYTRLGFEFVDQNASQRTEAMKKNADRLFQMCRAARTGDAEAKDAWANLFLGHDVNSWNVWQEAALNVVPVFRGDLVNIARTPVRQR